MAVNSASSTPMPSGVEKRQQQKQRAPQDHTQKAAHDQAGGRMGLALFFLAAARAMSWFSCEELPLSKKGPSKGAPQPAMCVLSHTPFVCSYTIHSHCKDFNLISHAGAGII